MVTGDPARWLGFQEVNHHVSLGVVQADDVDEDWRWPSLRVDDHYAFCEACGERWPLLMTNKGRPRGRYWWLCPRACNLSGQAAKRLLAKVEKGQPLPPGVTEADCRVVIARDAARREHVQAGGSRWTAAAIAERDRAAAMTDKELEAASREAYLLSLIAAEPPPRDPIPADLFEDF